MKKIDRRALVTRHNPASRNGVYADGSRVRNAPLSIGNGRFCFTVDESGLQTFPVGGGGGEGGFPLCTMAEWFWHRYPDAPPDDTALRLVPFETYGRKTGYATDERGQEELFYGLRRNAHKGNLARIGFDFPENRFTPVEQTLDMWTGSLRSVFRLRDGGGGDAAEPVITVEAVVHPDEDAVSLRVSSLRVSSAPDAPLSVQIIFPYPTHRKEAGDFTCPERHRTEAAVTEGGLRITRTIDETRLRVDIALAAGSACTFNDEQHTVTLNARGTLEFTVRFSEMPERPPQRPLPALFDECRAAAAAFWQGFWEGGAALDFGDAPASDGRARELERRIILSRYLLAIQGRGGYPNAETGLTCNSWYGKFHLEMHYWHSAHFAYWGFPQWTERSLGFYRDILPAARKLAASQGYRGARWPKMCDPTGSNAPSSIGVLLLWQQPSPIAFCELCRRVRALHSADEELAFMRDYRDVVIESAVFIADFFHYNDDGSVTLGPPVIPAQERFDAAAVVDPAFELAYFRWGLKTANDWLTRLGEAQNEAWTRLIAAIPPPAQADGVYLAHRNCPETFTKRPFNTDHPSMLMMSGYIPFDQTDDGWIDRRVMNTTFDRVLSHWDLDDLWGWDFPMMAMTALSLGRTGDALDLLLLDRPKNVYLPNGHNRQGDKEDLPLYLPGNASLLLAAALFAGRFPASWNVRTEGFLCPNTV